MGVNLLRERFKDWLEEYGPESRADFLAGLEKHVGQKIDVDAWQIKDNAYPRVGSYASYNIFRLCLSYVAAGDQQGWLGPDDDVEAEAVMEFRKALKPGSLKLPHVSHFLETGDTDTIFIPILFERPFVHEGFFVASLPGGVTTLQAFAAGLQLDLAGEEDAEFDNGKWLPVATAKNVARILYRFFTEKPGACVLLS